MKPSVNRIASRWMRTASDPSPAALKMLQVMAKKAGKTSTININLLKEVLNLIGWTCEETVSPIKLISDDQIKKMMSGLIRKHDARIWGYTGTKDPKEFWFEYKTDAKDFRDDLLSASTIHLVGKRGPNRAQVGHLYVGEVGEINRRESNNQWAIPTVLWWTGATSWKISSGSSSVMVSLRLDDQGRWDDPSSMKIARFWTWGYKNGLHVAAKTFLEEMGTEAVERATRPQSSRSLDNTGTCPCCFTNVKLSGGTLMRHGWKVQGQRSWGSYGNTWHSGSCYGVGFIPFEQSSEGTEKYLEVMKKGLKSAEDRQRDHARYPDKLIYMSGRKTETLEKPADFDADSPDWSKRYTGYKQYGEVHDRMAKQIARDITEMEDFIRTLESYIASWELKPLPGDR